MQHNMTLMGQREHERKRGRDYGSDDRDFHQHNGDQHSYRPYVASSASRSVLNEPERGADYQCSRQRDNRRDKEERPYKNSHHYDRNYRQPSGNYRQAEVSENSQVNRTDQSFSRTHSSSFHSNGTNGNKMETKNDDKALHSDHNRPSDQHLKAKTSSVPRSSGTAVGSDENTVPAAVRGQAPKFNRVANPFADPQTDAMFGSGLETDAHRIEQRLKMIAKGKNTIGYDNYLAAVPKEKRGHPQLYPRTPNPYEQQSKRGFDGRVRAWRIALHFWDDPEYRPDPSQLLAKKRARAEDEAETEGLGKSGGAVGEEQGEGEGGKRRRVEGNKNTSGHNNITTSSSSTGYVVERGAGGSNVDHDDSAVSRYKDVELAELGADEGEEAGETFSDEDVL